jgi:serine/threonine protein kinase
MSNPQPGQMLGPYQIISQVGKGGMATVYKAYHAAMDRYVAVKILPHEFMHNDLFMGRFQQEVRLIAKLEHKHILPVYDYGESKGIPFLVMRFLDTGTLKDRIQAGQLFTEEVDRYFTQLAEALAYAHAKGVIHRDIKPSNALVDETGDIFLMDFGIAKIVESTIQLTATGAITGTPAYMSPEQGQGLKVDHRTDIYSLGIVLYEMITGRVPFEAETPMAVIFKKIQEPLPPPSVYKPDINSEIEAVVLKALAKNPADRFATTQEFLAGWKRAYNAYTRQTAARSVPGTGTVTGQTIQVVSIEKKNGQEAAEAIQSVPALQATPPATPTRQEAVPPVLQATPGPQPTPARAEGIAPRQPAMAKTQPAPLPWKWLLPVIGLGGLLVMVVLAVVVGYLVPKLGSTTDFIELTVTSLAPQVQKTAAAQQAADLTSQPILVVVTAQPTRALSSTSTQQPTSRPLPSPTTKPLSVDGWTQLRIIQNKEMTDVLSNTVQNLVFSPDGNSVAAFLSGSYYNDVMYQFDVSTGQLIQKGGSFAISPDWKMEASGDSGWLNDLPTDIIYLYNASGEIKRLYGHKETIKVIAFSPDGHLLASGGYDKWVILWNTSDGSRIRSMNAGNTVLILAFSTDSRWLAVGLDSLRVILWDVQKGIQWDITIKGTYAEHAYIYGFTFAPDSNLLAIASGYSGILLWDVDNRSQMNTLEARRAEDGKLLPYKAVAFSPDGKTLAAGTGETIDLWDTQSKLVLTTLRNTQSISSLAFSPDGKMLAAGTDDGTIILWALGSQ